MLKFYYANAVWAVISFITAIVYRDSVLMGIAIFNLVAYYGEKFSETRI